MRIGEREKSPEGSSGEWKGARQPLQGNGQQRFVGALNGAIDQGPGTCDSRRVGRRHPRRDRYSAAPSCTPPLVLVEPTAHDTREGIVFDERRL
jgi:hypothetical protein